MEYEGDIILADRLIDLIGRDRQWNGTVITVESISNSIGKISETSEPFGDFWKHIPKQARTDDYHIARIIYYINHPEQIRDIEIDNETYGDYIAPIPVIVDGNHRHMALVYLNSIGAMEYAHCRYGGRQDLLEYLRGNIEYNAIEDYDY